MLKVEEVKIEVINKEISKAEKLFLEQKEKYQIFGKKTEKKIRKQFKEATNMDELKVSLKEDKIKFTNKSDEDDTLFLSDGNLNVKSDYYSKNFKLGNHTKFMLVTAKLLSDISKETNYYRFLIGKIESFMEEYNKTLELKKELENQLDLERARIRQRKIDAISHLIKEEREFNFDRHKNGQNYYNVIDFGGAEKINGSKKYSGDYNDYYVNKMLRYDNKAKAKVVSLFSDESLTFKVGIYTEYGSHVATKMFNKEKFKGYLVDYCTDADVQREIKMCELLF